MLGLYSLDLSTYVEVEIEGENVDDFVETIKEFVII